ncbi:MAG TPA: hypothetical protein VFX92_03325, partial [Candidatus Krumholzibacteria bacterium]|nr:hypothetical protein [Candidatus Krumholzibacteria bacterium]
RPESTVLLGTSRIQVGIVPEEWAAEMGGDPPLQLALVGTSPVKTLRYFATATDFRGLAVVGVVEMYVFDVASSGERVDEAVAEYRGILTSPARRSERALARLLPMPLLMRNQHLNFADILEAVWKRRPPRNLPGNMLPDRRIQFVPARLEPDDFDYSEFENAGRPATPAERDSIIADMRRSADTIRARGGRVVFVSFPACGERRAIEERRYPREDYWDPFVAGVAPALAIRCDDVPELTEFQCGDGSHLAEDDARRFTHVLARMVAERR